jgi:protein phosphatase 1 regulatory subunit 7
LLTTFTLQLTKLRRLDVQSNRLTKIENLTSQQETLEELYLAHNAIDDEGAFQPTGLQLSFPNLNVVDMCRNRLTSTSAFAHLEGLEELWISGNLIEAFDDVASLRDAPNQKLETVYLEYNPVASEFEYRKRLAEWIPSLKQIDATLIGGLAAHGYPSAARPSAAPIETMEQQLRRLQDKAIQRAKQETEGKHAIIES